MEPSSIPEQTLEELTRYVLDELPAERRLALEQELARCPELREEHTMLQQVLQGVAAEAPDSAPLTAAQRNRLRVVAGAGSGPAPVQLLPTGRWLIPLAMAASLVLAAFLMVFVNDDEHEPTKTGEVAETRLYRDTRGQTTETGPVRSLGAIAPEASTATLDALHAVTLPDLSSVELAPEARVQQLSLQTSMAANTNDPLATATGLSTLSVNPTTDLYGLPPGSTTYSFGLNPPPATGGGGGGADPTAGVFFNLGRDGDIRARFESMFESETPMNEALVQFGDLKLGDEPALGLSLGRYDNGGRPAPTVDDIFQTLSRRPGETPDMMFFRYWGDNPSVRTGLDPLSTFALDVDTASYSLIRNYLSKAILPPKEAVRTEEFVNSFRYDLTPAEDAVFALSAEVGPSPFGSDGMQLVRVGLKAKEVTREERKPVALTFVIDVSGSMQRENRLELVKQSLHLLVDQFDERDTIGIITFQSTAAQVLAPHSIQHRNLILGAIDGLQAEGSTNAGDGLLLGYQMALTQFRDEAENRILLLSDGVANTGITDVDGIFTSVEKYREGRIYLNSVGVGMGNHNDALLEQLADKGDGFYAYVDTMDEAEKVFVDRLVGSMQTVAKDARVQVEWNPDRVSRYRLLGYENRAVADQDFRSTSIDAGEIGAGHEVTALYEIEPRQEDADGPLGTIQLFFQEPESDAWIEQQREITDADGVGELGLTSPSFRLAASVAEFAELLRQSIWAREGSLGEVLTLAEPLVQDFDGDGDVSGFVALVRQAAALPDLLPERTDLVRTVDEFKRNQHLQAMLDELKHQQDDPLLRQLEDENRKLEQRIRSLIEQRLKDD